MKAITIHEFWSSAIFSHGKDIENRTWKTHHRGDLLIHAGSSTLSLNASKEWIRNVSTKAILRPLFGFVLGKVTLVDCIEDSPSSWAMEGHFRWVLSNPVRCWPFPVPGKQGLWSLDEEKLLFLPIAK